MFTNSKNKVVRISVATGTTAALIFIAHPVAAEDVVNTGYFGDVAIKGFDPVAYFTQSKAVEGSPDYSHHWLGATWHFASAENRELFIKEPTKYAPQYGGYCADGVSLGAVATNIDPKAWRIIGGKLYISYDPGAADGFEKNPAKVADSQKHWSAVQHTLVSEKLHTDWRSQSSD